MRSEVDVAKVQALQHVKMRQLRRAGRPNAHIECIHVCTAT